MVWLVLVTFHYVTSSQSVPEPLHAKQLIIGCFFFMKLSEQKQKFSIVFSTSILKKQYFMKIFFFFFAAGYMKKKH